MQMSYMDGRLHIYTSIKYGHVTYLAARLYRNIKYHFAILFIWTLGSPICQENSVYVIHFLPRWLLDYTEISKAYYIGSTVCHDVPPSGNTGYAPNIHLNVVFSPPDETRQWFSPRIRSDSSYLTLERACNGYRCSQNKMKSIGVIGGGVIGLATAAAILEDLPDVAITVYASEFSPNTTGDLSAGFIYPYIYGQEENIEDIVRWTNSTVQHLLKVAQKDEEAATAISPLSGYLLWKKGPITVPTFIKRCFMGARLVGPDEISKISHKKYAGGIFFTTWMCKCLTYLPCVMRELKSKGVNFVKERISSLDVVAEKNHDIVVNCAGIGAKELTSDMILRPVRGQVREVKAPWLKHFVTEEDGDSYVFPRIDSVVVGGTHTPDTSLKVDKIDSEKIWAKACEMVPSLSKAVTIGEHVGIRPGRSKIRIETEFATTGSGRDYIILHHYGHGGSGVTFHWGCAKQASKLLKEFLHGKSCNL